MLIKNFMMKVELLMKLMKKKEKLKMIKMKREVTILHLIKMIAKMKRKKIRKQ